MRFRYSGKAVFRGEQRLVKYASGHTIVPVSEKCLDCNRIVALWVYAFLMVLGESGAAFPASGHFPREQVPGMERILLPRTILRFIVFSLFSFLVIILLPESFFDPLNRGTASLAGLCIGLFVTGVEVAGDVISFNGFTVRIITECTALNSMALFASFVFARPAPWRERVAGLIAGGAILTVVNLLRIAVVTVVGAEFPSFFEAVHVYLGQVVMVLLVIGLAMLWLRGVSRSGDGPGPFLLRVAVLSSIIFPVWLVSNPGYVRALDRLVTVFFSLFDYRLAIDYQHTVYFQTFNIVLLIALIFAEQKPDLRRKLVWTLAGVAILAMGHLLFRIGNVLLVAFEWKSTLSMTVLLSVVGEYLLPVILWLAVSGRCMENGAVGKTVQ